MAFKSLFFVSLLLASIAFPMANAQGGLIGALLGLIQIQGIVPCSVSGDLGLNSTISTFPNAGVQLKCGGRVVASTNTNGVGAFSMVLDPLLLLSTVLSSCNLYVTTPLATCNAALPSVGGLLSSLQSTGNTLVGLLSITNLVPTGFKFTPST